MAIKTRRARAEITYNGRNISVDTTDFQTAFTYVDPATGESDTADLSLADPDGLWCSDWMPAKGDTLAATIVLEDDAAGDPQRLACGTFTLDSFSFSDGNGGRALSISGVSAPQSEAWGATERTKVWEGVSLKRIAQTIAARYGLALAFDGEDVPLGDKEQSKRTDSAFLSGLCEDYGRSIKVYAKRLVIFDREAYKKADAVQTIDRADCVSFSWKTDIAGGYTGGTASYAEAFTGDAIKVQVGTGPRLLAVNESFRNAAEAKRRLQAAVDAANHGTTSASVTVPGNPALVAGQCILLTGFGKLSGKYYIDKKTDSLGAGGYTSALELALVATLEEVAVESAIKRLSAMGVITAPAYWQTEAKKDKALAALFVKASAVIQKKGTQAPTVAAGLDRLCSAGVVTDRALWSKKAKAAPMIGTLLQKLGGSV